MLKRCVAGVGLLVIIILSIMQINSVNNKYPNPHIITYLEKEKIKGGDICIYVQGAELLTYDEFVKNNSSTDFELLNMDGKQLSPEKIQVMVVDVEAENTGDVEQEMSMENFILQSGAWSNGWDMDLFLKLNHLQSTLITLKPQEKKSVKLGYCMYQFQYQKKDWETISKRKYDLVLSTYPVKNKVHLAIAE